MLAVKTCFLYPKDIFFARTELVFLYRLSISFQRHLVIESIVGWSKSTVGDISSSHLFESAYANAVVARESKLSDINGKDTSTKVPSDKHAIECTIALASR